MAAFVFGTCSYEVQERASLSAPWEIACNGIKRKRDAQRLKNRLQKRRLDMYFRILRIEVVE